MRADACSGLGPVAPAGGRGGRSDGCVHPTATCAPAYRSVSVTTEFAHNDFALGSFAVALGLTADRDALVVRSRRLAGAIRSRDRLSPRARDGRLVLEQAFDSTIRERLRRSERGTDAVGRSARRGRTDRARGKRERLRRPTGDVLHGRAHRVGGDRSRRRHHGRSPASVLLGGQRARHPRAVSLRARRSSRSHARVGALGEGRDLRARRRRPSRQRRRRHALRVVQSGARSGCIRSRAATATSWAFRAFPRR